MTWVLLAVIVALLVISAFFVARQLRSRKLKSDFGPEYARVAAEHGDRRSAERELAARQRRFEQFEIRPLEPAARKRYLKSWSGVQRAFVDAPGEAVVDADLLVRQVMEDRGYPAENEFEQRAADISVEHPQVVENYRAAHAISIRAHSGRADTEQLRQAMVHFRALFADLLDLADPDEPHDDGGQRDPRVAPDQRETPTSSDQGIPGTARSHGDPGAASHHSTTKG